MQDIYLDFNGYGCYVKILLLHNKTSLLNDQAILYS